MRISPQADIAFSLATREAAKRCHEWVTLEHLLYAMLFDPDTASALRNAGGDLHALKGRLVQHLGSGIERSPEETNPGLSHAFQRVVGRAAMHAQTRGKDELGGCNILVAMFAEHDSPAVAYLTEHGVTRYDFVNYIAHGVSKAGGSVGVEAPPEEAAPPPEAPPPPAQTLLLQVMFVHASHAAARRGHPSTSPAHILYSLLLTDEAAQIVRGAGVAVPALRASLEKHLDVELATGPRAGDHAPLSAPVHDCLERMSAAASARGVTSLGVTDMLFAIAEEADSPAAKALREHGFTSLRGEGEPPEGGAGG